METLEPERGTAITAQRDRGRAGAGDRDGGRLRRDGGGRAAGRDHHGLRERQARDASPRRTSCRSAGSGSRCACCPPTATPRPWPTTPATRTCAGLRVIIAGGRHVGRASRCRRRPHRPAGDRRPDQGQEHRRRRARRAAVGGADASRRSGRVRGDQRRAQRGGARRPHPRVLCGCAAEARASRLRRSLDRALHAPRDGARLVRAAQARGLARRSSSPSARRSPSRESCPPRIWRQIKQAPPLDPEAVRERERTTNHDVAAFVDVVAESVGEAGRWIHFGLTSSDVLDTGARASAARGRAASSSAAADALTGVLARRAREFRDTLCVGRTHGVHAEPTTFGLKLAGFAFESRPRARTACGGPSTQAEVGKLSGAVGTYSALGPEVERAALERLGLRAEDRLDAGRAARPPRRGADARSRSRAPRSSGSPPRSATSSAPRCGRSRSRSARARRARARCRTSATRSRASAITGLARAPARLRAGRPRERRPVARARHLALVGRAGRAARRHHAARTTCST